MLALVVRKYDQVPAKIWLSRPVVSKRCLKMVTSNKISVILNKVQMSLTFSNIMSSAAHLVNHNALNDRLKT